MATSEVEVPKPSANRTRYTLKFGALAEPIMTQLDAQGFTLDCTAHDRQVFQSCANALILLHGRQILQAREVERARARLLKKISRYVCEKKAMTPWSED